MSLKEIAEITGLSVATVSHAINGTRGVSEKSQALVEAAVAATGYKPNRAARVLKTNRSNTIALVIPNVEPGRSTNFFFMNVLSGAKDALSGQGYDLIVSTYTEEGGDDTRAELTVLQKQWVDGMLLVPGEKQSQAVELVAQSGIPFVLIDRTVENAACPCVHSDNFAATVKAIRLFHSCGKRRIAYLGGMTGYSTGYDRFSGYRQALEELGLPYDPAIVRHDVEYGLDAGRTATSQLLDQKIDAIFTSNNILTMGALQCLGARGLIVPSDIGIIGYEDYEWMEIFSPPITTVQQQSYAMGAIGAEMLLSLLSGTPLPRPHQILEAPLIIRSSHGRVGGQCPLTHASLFG